MKIIADENIPCVEQAFASLGDVELLPGRGMRAEQVRDADILLVRSVTRVDEGLLAGSKVRFVGSATIGFDHVDRKYLQGRDIGFSTAPGSNAISASEYVISALVVVAARDDIKLAEKTVGIIGCGNVGSRVLEKLSALGVECLVNDPPLKAQGGHENYVELDALLQADIITVHVPLVTDGDFPTFHLVDKTFLEKLKPGAVLVNASRGAVVDNSALDDLLDRRDDLSVVLDVWEGEPGISMSLLEKVTLGTSHIAGYSLDGKLRGTEMIYRAACKYFQHPVQWSAANELPAGHSVDAKQFIAGDVPGNVCKAVLDCYDVRDDDEQLRAVLSVPPQERPVYFDRLRKEYPVRREFQTMKIPGAGIDKASQAVLQGLGFIFPE
jgi:erythronate-4-phosphate dehydrogenase